MNHELQINGLACAADTQADTPLLWVLRDVLGLTGTKFGCGAGLCGACTVQVDGVATRSCLTPVGSVVGKAITTIEGVGQGPVGAAVQKAWIELDVVQCGYCQPGQIMSATALLSAHARPSDEQIDQGMAGNLCRCGTYGRIREAVKLAARTIPIAGAPGKS